MSQVFCGENRGKIAIETVRYAFVIGQSICVYFKCHKVVCSSPARADVVPKQFAIAFICCLNT